MNPEADDPIEEQAANWLARREEGFSPQQAREFDRWRHADPRHAGAVARLERACAWLEKMPLVANQLAPLRGGDERDSPGRRVRWRAPVGLAAALLLGAAAWWQWSPQEPAAPAAHYATTAGGYERVTLRDGSVLELNANSVARVSFSPGERRVTLAAGEAHFSVAHDTARPFIVDAGGLAVRAVGTAFNVRLASAEVEVLVTEGTVRVEQSAGPASAAGATRAERETRDGAPAGGNPAFLRANERVVVSMVSSPESISRQIEKMAPAAIREALSWQERKLVFAETPLRDVVAQFNHRNLTQLTLADAALGQRPVGGTFAADNVAAFVRLLESSGDIVAERRSEREIVLRRAK